MSTPVAPPSPVKPARRFPRWGGALIVLALIGVGAAATSGDPEPAKAEPAAVASPTPTASPTPDQAAITLANEATCETEMRAGIVDGDVGAEIPPACAALGREGAQTILDKITTDLGLDTEATTPAPEPEPAEPAGPALTVAQEQAIESAESYVAMDGFSKKGLIQQLTSEYGEGFKPADAKFAVEHIKVDWKAEAVESGRGYLDMGGFSRSGLIQQLSSSAGEQFTKSQATYAADQLGL